jgi:hypothetical protein
VSDCFKLQQKSYGQLRKSSIDANYRLTSTSRIIAGCVPLHKYTWSLNPLDTNAPLIPLEVSAIRWATLSALIASLLALSGCDEKQDAAKKTTVSPREVYERRTDEKVLIIDVHTPADTNRGDTVYKNKRD